MNPERRSTPREEFASDHIRNALQVLGAARDLMPQPHDPRTVTLLRSEEHEAIVSRLVRALAQLEQTSLVSPSLSDALQDGGYRS